MANAIEFKLGADSRALKTGLDAAKSQVSNFKGQVGGILTGLFAGASAASVRQLVSEFARFQDIADGLGTTAEAVQRVKVAAEQAGTSVEAIAKAMAKLRADGGDALAKLGIDAREFANSEMDQQILMVSAALDKIPDPQQRINSALEVFGVKGREILPLLAQGFESLKTSIDGATVATNESVRALADADDTLSKYGNNAKVLFADIAGFMFGVGKDVKLAGYMIKELSSVPVSKLGDAWKQLSEDIELARWQEEEMAKISSQDKAKAKAAAFNASDSDASGEKSTAQKEANLSDAEKNFADKNEKVKNMARLGFSERIRMAREAAKKEAEADVAEKKKAFEKIAEMEAEKNKRADQIANEKQQAEFDARKESIGFVSGANNPGGTFGQQFAGVNNSVINAEAEKSIRLQEEMAGYLRSIDQKNWTVEIPEAS